MQSLFTSSPFSDPLNVNMLPSSNTGTGAHPYSVNGPNISLVNPKIDASNLLTIIVFFVLGTFLLTLVLLAALYAKRLVEKNFFSIPPFCSMYTLVVVSLLFPPRNHHLLRLHIEFRHILLLFLSCPSIHCLPVLPSLSSLSFRSPLSSSTQKFSGFDSPHELPPSPFLILFSAVHISRAWSEKERRNGLYRLDCPSRSRSLSHTPTAFTWYNSRVHCSNSREP